MIRTFRSKPLAELFATSASAKIDAKLQRRVLRRLDALNQAGRPEDMAIPGFNFHALKGFDPVRYTVHVNGPWCVTFAFSDGDAFDVDFEQYH
jgi:proteic killer suppression protein